MANILTHEGATPQIAEDAFIAPTATLIGAVTIEAGASVWFGAVLRADFDRIVVGEGSCVQDNAVIHTNAGLPTLIGRNVTVGHLALLEGCIAEDGCLIGMGSIALNRSRVGRGSMLAAGSVLTEGTELPPGILAAGTPASVKKDLDGSSANWVSHAAKEYQALRLRYMNAGTGE